MAGTITTDTKSLLEGAVDEVFKLAAERDKLKEEVGALKRQVFGLQRPDLSGDHTVISALELCWQVTGEAIAGDCKPGKLMAANRAALKVLARARKEVA